MTEQLTDDVADALASEASGSSRRQRARVTRWDRPPEPHDWRFFVGGLGRILIATGLLMFGFVAYQLWGTGIQTARAQSRLENRFEAALAAGATATTPTDSPASSPVATTPDRPDDPAVPNTTTPGEPVATPAVTPSDSAPSPTTAPGAPEAVVQDIPPIRRNEPLARLEIPAIGKDVIVVPGVDLDDLKDGPGHYPDTPLPGQLGNASIAGHRTTYGEPFRQIDELVPGDELIVTMITGEKFVYAVTGTEIVAPSDYFVVTTSDPTVAELTLTSCDPEFTSTNRIVVHALLDPARSAQVGVPTFYDLDAESPETPETPDAPDAGTDASDVAPSSENPVVTQPGEDAPTAGEPSAGGPAEDPLVPGAAPGRSTAAGDAFEAGWFDDKAAFPHVALWGAACGLVAFGFSRVSRRFRRYSVGFAFAIVPFAIALYFFYENVNRLLPPGL